MVTAQELVDSSTRQVLVDQALDLGLSVKDEDGKPLNKLELAEAILEVDAAELEEDEETVESDEQPEPEPEPEVSEVESEPAPLSEPEPESEGDDEGEEVLVRFVGAHSVLQVAGQQFKKYSPFKVLSEDEAQEIFDSKHGHKFRAATPREAKEFYS